MELLNFLGVPTRLGRAGNKVCCLTLELHYLPSGIDEVP